MKVKKLSNDVRERLQSIIVRRAVGLNELGDAEVEAYQAILHNKDFWHNSDREPRLLEKYLGFFDGRRPVRRQYIFRNSSYIVKGKYTAEEEKLLIQDDFDSERRKFERLQHKFALANRTEPRTDRTAISEDVRIAVWRRDGGKCVRCGSRERLEYDHIIPMARGGSSTVRNIELLCQSCNRSKGANIV